MTLNPNRQCSACADTSKSAIKAVLTRLSVSANLAIDLLK